MKKPPQKRTFPEYEKARRLLLGLAITGGILFVISVALLVLLFLSTQGFL